MFLDEELEAIVKEDSNITMETVKKLLNACFNRIPDAKTCDTTTFLNSLKQVENSWRLFCSRNKKFMPNGFKNACFLILSKDFSKDEIDQFKTFMKW